MLRTRFIYNNDRKGNKKRVECKRWNIRIRLFSYSFPLFPFPSSSFILLSHLLISIILFRSLHKEKLIKRFHPLSRLYSTNIFCLKKSEKVKVKPLFCNKLAREGKDK